MHDYNIKNYSIPSASFLALCGLYYFLQKNDNAKAIIKSKTTETEESKFDKNDKSSQNTNKKNRFLFNYNPIFAVKQKNQLLIQFTIKNPETNEIIKICKLFDYYRIKQSLENNKFDLIKTNELYSVVEENLKIKEFQSYSIKLWNNLIPNKSIVFCDASFLDQLIPFELIKKENIK